MAGNEEGGGGGGWMDVMEVEAGGTHVQEPRFFRRLPLPLYTPTLVTSADGPAQRVFSGAFKATVLI